MKENFNKAAHDRVKLSLMDSKTALGKIKAAVFCICVPSNHKDRLIYTKRTESILSTSKAFVRLFHRFPSSCYSFAFYEMRGSILRHYSGAPSR